MYLKKPFNPVYESIFLIERKYAVRGSRQVLMKVILIKMACHHQHDATPDFFPDSKSISISGLSNYVSINSE